MNSIKRAVLSTAIVIMSTYGTMPLLADVGEPLTIGEAETIALQQEPGEVAMRAKADAFRDRAVAADELPDPQLRLGIQNLPTDTFALDQEPMTQTQIGFRQMFPASGTLSARSAQFEANAEALSEVASDRRRQVLLATREAWLDLLYWIYAEEVLRENRALFSDLVDITRTLYAQGRKNQQDVLRAELELSRLDDRIVSVTENISVARARLAQWVGPDNAARPLPNVLPTWPSVSQKELLDGIHRHPRLLALKHNVMAAKGKIAEADSAYNPSWSIDLGYGKREGVDALGAPRSDFVSIMLNVDIPLFTTDRQDRQLSASRHERFSVELEHQRALLELRRQAESEWSRWEKLQERAALYDSSIIGQARQQTDASIAAYQNQRGDFADVMRAAITQLDVQLEERRIITDLTISRARIEFLGGSNYE